MAAAYLAVCGVDAVLQLRGCSPARVGCAHGRLTLCHCLCELQVSGTNHGVLALQYVLLFAVGCWRQHQCLVHDACDTCNWQDLLLWLFGVCGGPQVRSACTFVLVAMQHEGPSTQQHSPPDIELRCIEYMQTPINEWMSQTWLTQPRLCFFSTRTCMQPLASVHVPYICLVWVASHQH